ncbi:MAG TPA: cardiolipin synthase [Candidatus Sulfomarinibacteraceae bacterium]|nr:cardiolipin synthase [Candidatus Sulfomarinibacteraceae bacterium]
MIVVAVAVFHVLGFLSSIHAIMTTRTEQGAIAWAVSLNTFPYVAVPAYWVLGRSRFHGYVSARQREMAEVAALETTATEAARQFVLPTEQISPAGRAAVGLAKLPFLRGNSVELLVDGDATFASILEGIDAAEEYILFQFFIVHDDEIGRQVKAHLIERARAGVRVYFLYDEVGSHDLPRAYRDELREAGVEVYDFHTRKGPRNRFQINFRNHRKVVVVDGKAAWVGGHNVGDEYLGRNPEFGHWRDTHVRIEGPAALGAQVSFAEDWYWATERWLDLSWTPAASGEADIPILILPSGPADELETANLMFVHAINSAQDRIWIASPYFVPDRPVITALQLAGLRGVDVRVLIPDMPDHLSVYLAAFSYLDESTSTGVDFYRYQDGFLHQKVMLIDDSVATVGTANFDNRSFRLNFEITAVIAGTDFASQVERMLENDFAKSRLMAPGEVDAKPWWFRFAVKLARLTAPVQ